MFSIGDLSDRTGVKVTTIRFYEQKGLIAPEGRTSGNQRRYGCDGLARLAFIAHARALGLPLDAVAELISLEGRDAHDEVHRIADTHLASIRQRIERLKRLERELARIGAACAAGEGEPCGILAALADHGQCDGRH